MITIYELNEKAAQSMTEELGERIFISKVYDGEENFTVTLSENVELKFYGFDRSLTIQLGSNKFLLEQDEYRRIELE